MIAEQGLGYMLFAGALLVISYLYRQLINEKEKRVSDLVNTREVYMTTLKDLLNTVQNMQKTVDSIVTVLDSLRWRKK